MRRAAANTRGSDEGSISHLIDKKKSKTLVTPHHHVLLPDMMYNR